VEFASKKIFEDFIFSPFILSTLFRVLFYLSCLCIFIAENIVSEDSNIKFYYLVRLNAGPHYLFNSTVAGSLITLLLMFHASKHVAPK
jgi:hypothetical protein